MSDRPITLSQSTYKQLRVMVNTINNITDVVAMGGDVRKELVVNLIVKLIEQASETVEQIERDDRNDTIEN